MRLKTTKTIAGIFLIGLTLFMYEISLTRLFSTILWYHYVFMAISLAMLGWTIGGVYAFNWFKNQKKPDDSSIMQKKVSILGLLSLTILSAMLFLYKIPFHPFLIVFYIVFSTLPFIFGGYYLSLVFKEWVTNSNTLYFADLLGSAIGSIVIVILLNNYSLIRVGILLSLIPNLVLALHFRQAKYKVTGVIVTLSLISLLLSQGNIVDNWSKEFGVYKGNPKMLGTLFDGKPRIVYTFWNSLARTDVVEFDSEKNKTVLVDGGAASVMIPFHGNLGSVGYLKKELGYFPFAYKKNQSALLIGPGGGKDILLAKLAGIEDITAVEINPGSVVAAQEFKEFNGNIYNLDGVNTYVEDGRSFIAKDSKKYDVIFLSLVMTQSSETLGYALSENYIYTKEAFQAYLDHLAPGGTLAFVLHGENDLAKASTTLLKIFTERGIPREQAAKYMTVLNSRTSSGQTAHLMYPLLMVKNTPFTEDESEAIIDLSLDAQTGILSLPKFKEQLLQLVPPESQERNYLVTDNYPFFYHQGRLAPWLIINMLIASLILGNYITGKSLEMRNKDVSQFKAYFSYIGIGFMLIEIPLIQKLILLFGHPTLTFSAVISILLLTAGLGSLLGNLITKKLSLKAIGTLIFIYAGLLLLVLPKFIDTFQGSNLSLKILATFILLLPLGLLMGIPFPSGLQMLEKKEIGSYVPLMWGVNGWMSVVGSILSLVIAMSFGYNITLLLGAVVYLVFAVNTGKIELIQNNS